MLSKAAKLKPDAAAKTKAEALRMLREQKTALEAEIETVEGELRQYVADTGEVSIGPMLAYERLNPPKLVGASGKSLEAHQDVLVRQFPGYVQQKLNLTAMLASLGTDPSLRDALEARGLQISREIKWYFKAAAEVEPEQ